MSPNRSLTPVLAAAALVALLAWPAVASAATVRVQDDDARLRYHGATKPVVERSASSWGRRTLTPGASLEASFTGTAISWIGPRASGFGSARVWLDGSQVATVSAGGARAEQRTLWSSGALADGPHTLRIDAIDSVSVDALAVTGTPGVPEGPHAVSRVEERNPRIAYTDFFRLQRASSHSAGSALFSKVPNARVTLEFTGTDVAWIGRKWAGGGRARVVLDGVEQGIVSLYSPATRSNRVIYSRSGLADGPHTLSVVVLGSRDAASKSTDVCVDAFDVGGSLQQALRKLEDDDRRIRYSGAWRTVPGSGGTTRTRSWHKGDGATVKFWGSEFAVRAFVGPSSGKASIYVDGAYTATADTYAPSADGNVTVWQDDSLSPGYHTVTVKVAGTRHADSGGTSVSLDSLVVGGSPTVLGAASGHRRADATRSVFARSGRWSRFGSPGATGGSGLTSSAKGSKFYVEFVGSGFTWYGTKQSRGGRAKVTIDGKSAGTVSLYSASRADQRAVFSYGGLPNKRHRVVIQVLGSHESASRGNGVSVDWFDVSGRFVQARRPSPFGYPWATYIVIDKSECNLYWVRNGWLVKVYRCAVGKASTPTPERTWKILAKYHTDPRSVYGPRKMRMFKQVGGGFQYTAYNLHGTNQPWVIGTWASHGCIRMYNRDVLELFPQVPIGTMVVTKG